MSSTLKRTTTRLLAAAALALQAAAPASAAHVEAVLSRVGGNTWDISFTVGADAGQTVEAFSIYFDWTQVSNLAVGASPADWDSLVIAEDLGLSSDGLFDTLALAGSITGGNSLGGFSARFDWADPAGPGALRFTVNNPLSFDVLEEGAVELRTDGGGGKLVPEPGSGGLLLTAALAGAIARSRMFRRTTTS